MTAAYAPSSAGIAHTRNHPCKVCGGYREMPQHVDVRCWGKEFDTTIVCVRPQYSSGCKEGVNGWTHYKERCPCGVNHITGARAPISWDTSWVSTSRRPSIGGGGRSRSADSFLNEPTRTRDYKYFDDRGDLLAIHRRHDYVDGRKTFSWVTVSRTGRETSGLQGRPMATLPLYKLSDILEAPAGSLIVFTEGEKACESLLDRGILATCLGTGANGVPSAEVLEPLRDKVICLWPDADPVGLAWMGRVAASVAQVAERVTWLEIPGADKGDDAADWVGDNDECVDLICRAPGWFQPQTTPATEVHTASDTRGPRVDTKMLKPRVQAVLEAAGEYPLANSVRDCRLYYAAGRCANCGSNVANPISCKHPACPQCMPGRLRADFKRSLGALVEGQRFNLYRLRPMEPIVGVDQPLRIARQRFTEARERRKDLQGGITGSVWHPTDGAQMLLALHESSVMPAEYATFKVELVAGGMDGLAVAGWLSEEYLVEVERWVASQETLTDSRDRRDAALRYARETRARHRYQGFGSFYKRAETPSSLPVDQVDNSGSLDEPIEDVKVTLGGKSGGNYARHKGERGCLCWACGQPAVDFTSKLRLPEERVTERGAGSWSWA